MATTSPTRIASTRTAPGPLHPASAAPPARDIQPYPAFHTLPADDVVAALSTHIDTGLTAAEADRRLAEYGPNLLPKSKGDTPLTLLWRQINSPLIWVLIASGIVAMVVDPTDGIKNGLVILAVVILNTLIGFVQEFKAGKAIEALSKMVPDNVTVLRDGQKQTLPAAQLVPGDVVMLASGDKVPADLRLVYTRSLKIEEAALTGESVPAEKDTAASAEAAGLGDRTGMAFGGTLVTYGTATAVVVTTGARTELGRISAMLESAENLQTPLTRALASIGKYITIGIIVVAVLILVVGTFRAMQPAPPPGTEVTFFNAWSYGAGMGLVPAVRETVIFAIALAVGAIPEGLPAIVTIALAIGVQRMAARRAVIRKLPAVETLGSTTTICSDKTGTLTRNEMIVQAAWTSRGAYRFSGVGYSPHGEITRVGDPDNRDLRASLPADLTDLLTAAALCNDATLRTDTSHANAAEQHHITGDPTEGALVVAAEKAGLSVDSLRQTHRRLDTLPFESENQFMATLHAPPPTPTPINMPNHASCSRAPRRSSSAAAPAPTPAKSSPKSPGSPHRACGSWPSPPARKPPTHSSRSVPSRAADSPSSASSA